MKVLFYLILIFSFGTMVSGEKLLSKHLTSYYTDEEIMAIGSNDLIKMSPMEFIEKINSNRVMFVLAQKSKHLGHDDKDVYIANWPSMQAKNIEYLIKNIDSQADAGIIWNTGSSFIPPRYMTKNTVENVAFALLKSIKTGKFYLYEPMRVSKAEKEEIVKWAREQLAP